MKSCRECPYQSDIYGDLTDEQFELIDSHRYEVVYEPGEVIFKQGTVSTHVLSFVTGLAKMSIEIPRGGSLVVRIIRPHEFIAGTGLFMSEKYRFSVTALETSMVCLIDITVIKRLIMENSKFAVSLLSHFQKNMSYTLERLVSFYSKHHIGRLAEALLYLADEIYRENPYELKLSRKDLAGLAGISKENTQRLLKSLETGNIIQVKGKVIEILDMDKLRQISVNG